MTIEATYSKYRKNNFKIGIVICIIAAVYCWYDGYYNETFIEEHKNDQGIPDSTLVFNQKSPPFFIAGAVLLAVFLFATKNKKVIADENELIINNKEKIPFDSIQKIDKTIFESKGSFLITYKDKNSNEINRRLSSNAYDNLAAIVEQVVVKIT